ncbi:PhzF family phenazine biosynthesis protein [Micromonospora sp. NPDC023956]|uniref:PhzF family phenazine biosynthesis protein n=1 Tax=Micromonospora sp. NPDC023956 TaxID=3155722 RepID=UPI0033F28FC4
MIRYERVGMFATGASTGSPLTVVPHADGLPTGAMHVLARRFGTPETTFVLPPTMAGADYRVRVFTPAGESPYGGHSALGTAVTLHRLGVLPSGRLVQQCGTRLLPVTVTPGGGTITAAAPLPGAPVDRALLVAAVGLDPADLAAGPARTAGFGPLFHYLPVHPDAVRRARPDLALMCAGNLPDVLVLSWDRAARRAEARLFAPGYGMPEDPACAPVALGLGAWLVAAKELPVVDGTHTYRIEQGAGTAPQGRLDCTVTVAAGRVSGASVSGRVAPVDRGELAVPGSGPVEG